MATAFGQFRRTKPVTNANGIATPAWDVALAFPLQGDWTEEDYLELEARFGNRMIELADGYLEVLPAPSLKHQRIVKWLLARVDDYVVPRKLGEALMAPLPVRLFQDRIREPDIMFFEARRILDTDRRPVDGADLVMEVPSPGRKNRERDLRTKRTEYARAKIPEYWIVDTVKKTITVLTLSGKSYKIHGVYKPGEQAASKLLKGFTVAVSVVFAAGEGR